MKNQKGNILIILIIIVLIALALWWFIKSGYRLPGQTAFNNQAPVIQNTADLDSATKELNNTDLNQIDAGINQISSDSSSF